MRFILYCSQLFVTLAAESKLNEIGEDEDDDENGAGGPDAYAVGRVL